MDALRLGSLLLLVLFTVKFLFHLVMTVIEEQLLYFTGLCFSRGQFESSESPESASILYKVCHTLCSWLARDNLSKEKIDNFAAVHDLPAVIYELTCKAITSCNPG